MALMILLLCNGVRKKERDVPKQGHGSGGSELLQTEGQEQRTRDLVILRNRKNRDGSGL